MNSPYNINQAIDHFEFMMLGARTNKDKEFYEKQIKFHEGLLEGIGNSFNMRG